MPGSAGNAWREHAKTAQVVTEMGSCTFGERAPLQTVRMLTCLEPKCATCAGGGPIIHRQ